MNNNEDRKISEDFNINLGLITEMFSKDACFRKRIVRIGGGRQRAAFLFFDGMAEGKTLDDSLVRSAVTAKNAPYPADADYITENVFYSAEISKAYKIGELAEAMLSGDTAILIEFSEVGLTADTKGFATRSINEPKDEKVLSGPREGFNESAIMNMALVRRKLQTNDLCIESLKTGRRTNTAVFFLYLGTLVNEQALKTLKNRMEKINIDGVLDTNYLAEQIRDKRYSPIKTTGTTERPDVVAARLLEGRIAVMVDGTPVALTVPYLFSENFQSDEDYYINFFSSSFGRSLRYVSFFLSAFIPAVYTALTTFHIELLPTSFILSAAKLRSGVPFSTVGECIFLIIVFEILKEAGLRSPENFGTALGIVGGLVIGQAAVTARLISAPALIVVALSGVAGLMVPRLRGASLYLKIASVVLSAYLGIVGLLTVMTLFLFSVLGAESFETDYTPSLKTPTFQRLKDTVIRASIKDMLLRPDFNRNIVRKGKNNE